MSSLAGRELGRYIRLEPIGQGGMATVYKAFDPAHEREVAIKVLSPGMAQNDQFSKRFQREANLVLQLKHPHIVPVQDFGQENGYAYLVMPYMVVGSLTDHWSEVPLSLFDIAKMVGQISDALDFAHRKGVVHRDVKPSNIMLDEAGNALLSDFGLAYIHDASLSLTGSALIGTPTYMSPEQALGLQVDARSDQYSFGIILYQLLTGHLPFEAETPMAVLMKHMHEPVPLPRSVNPAIPEIIERVVLKSLAKDPLERFSSIADMNAAFQAAVSHSLDPDANPAPNIKLPHAPLPTEVFAPRDHRRFPWESRWVQWGSLAAGILLTLLALPVASSGLLSMLERAASPALSSAPSKPRTEVSAQLTALAATIDAFTARTTPTPSPIPVEYLPAAVAVNDTFDSDAGTFETGEGKQVRDGAFFLGPFEHCANDEAAFDAPIGCNVVCETCGSNLQNYHMEVDLGFLEGLSEGGFGVMLRFLDVDQDSLLDREDYQLTLAFDIFNNEWMVYVHEQDRVDPWHLVRRGPAGLRPLGWSNRLEVTAENGGRIIDVFLNDYRIVKLTGDPPKPGETLVREWIDSGAVGFTTLSRRVLARYDNFLLEPNW